MFRYLFDNRLDPVTSDIGFLQCSADVAAEHFVSWQEPLFVELGVNLTVTKCAGELATVLKRLAPLTSVLSRRYLFVPTRSEWTAYFDNGHRGGDPSSSVSYMSEYIGCCGLRVCCVPHTIDKSPDGNYGATMLEIYGPEPNPILNIERAIDVSNDGGRWTFDTSGEPLPFEDLEAYKARRIRDRFTPEMLRDYLLELGVDAFSESFYTALEDRPAFLIEKHGPRPKNMREFPFPDGPAA